MSARRRPRNARRTFVDDQRDAATDDVAQHVADSAHRTGRQVTDIGESKFGTVAGDELATWFIRAYIGAVTSGLTPCPHLAMGSAPAPSVWNSAIPTEVVCRAYCAGLGRDLQLRARRLLPARCGQCRIREATLTLDIAYGDARSICHVCPVCMATHSPRGGDVA